MTDLTHLMSSLVNHKGRIAVDGLYDSVAKLTSEEEKLYGPIDFDMVSTGSILLLVPGNLSVSGVNCIHPQG